MSCWDIQQVTEIPEAGPVATGTQAGHPAGAGSHTEASPTAPTEASAPATVLAKTAEAKEDLLTVEEEAQHHIGIRSVTLSNLPPPQQMKVNYILIEHLIATELSILHSS